LLQVLHRAADVLPGGIGEVEVRHQVVGFVAAVVTLPR